MRSAETAGIDITGLTADSRQVQPGFLFAALPGSHADGRDYIVDALRRGAAAVLAAPGTPLPDPSVVTPVPLISDENPRRRFALLSARFYGRQPRVVCAVTGTNGKTSVVWFLRQIWEALGHPAASLGTLGVTAPGLSRSGSLTTPDPVSLHAILAELADADVQRLAMEASSHGLDQYRLDGVRIVGAAFTNLTRDHLDYHGTMEDYLRAKLRLFSELVEAGGAAVICADDPVADQAARIARGHRLRVSTYGRAGEDLRIASLEPVASGQRMLVVVDGVRRELVLPLAGEFMAANALASAGLALATGGKPDAVFAALEGLRPVRGRLERVADAGGGSIYVDYAHTPDALDVALRALRPRQARLLVVFGCGGDRDPGKRAEMGRIAAARADLVIVTDDNPRSEDPALIRRAVLAGCPDATEIGDRAEAIAAGIRALRPGDVLLVAGKGHESGQIVGARVLPFDDAEAVRAAVRDLGA